MDDALHPLAPHHMPGFITAPGETDALLVAMIVLLVGSVLLVGNFYLQLHSLPERMAHRTTQFQVVAVLGLLALFTHQHVFWIAALLLAMIRFPDVTTPLNRIAESLEEQGGRSRPVSRVEAAPAGAEPAPPAPLDRDATQATGGQ
jgi:hypothetical protein